MRTQTEVRIVLPHNLCRKAQQMLRKSQQTIFFPTKVHEIHNINGRIKQKCIENR